MALNPFATFKCEQPHYHAELMPRPASTAGLQLGNTPSGGRGAPFSAPRPNARPVRSKVELSSPLSATIPSRFQCDRATTGRRFAARRAPRLVSRMTMDTTKLTRRPDPDRKDCWLIMSGDIVAGNISRAVGLPGAAQRWAWFCGFYPGSKPGEQAHGTGSAALKPERRPCRLKNENRK